MWAKNWGSDLHWKRSIQKERNCWFTGNFLSWESELQACAEKGTVLLSTSLVWLAAARQKLSLNLAPFLLLNPVQFCSHQTSSFLNPRVQGKCTLKVQGEIFLTLLPPAQKAKLKFPFSEKFFPRINCHRHVKDIMRRAHFWAAGLGEPSGRVCRMANH